MNDDRPSLKTIFLRARALFGPERQRVIDETCGGDAALAATVLELLAVDAGLGDEDDGGADRLVGRRIGDFVVHARIGSGGMGVVYAAEQQQPRRMVALKVLHGFASTALVLRRFRNESELLARLAHPNIAQVFAAGAVPIDGHDVPYIAMELVAGARIVTEFAERASLSLPDRIRLLATACEAVEHGHRKGVIHRDLKPDNILVGADGSVKLIDFGVARVLDTATVLATVQTLPGELIGTLQYMCPEQCTGVPDDLDVRGDVYSLGVVLYELVAGRPPIDLSDATWVTAIHRIQTELPPPARHWRPSVPRALDIILGKALAKHRDHRYPSATALGDDLRAMLAGRPIAAQPPSAWLRLVGWLGRHPFAATAAACGGLAVVVVLALWALARHYAAVPDRVTTGTSLRTVQLLSRTGNVLQTWSLDWPIDDASFVPEDAAHGPLVLIAHGGGVAGDPHSGQVVAYDATARSTQPAWTTAVDLESFEAVRRRNPQQYCRTKVLVTEDLLPEVPGTEVMVAQYLWHGDYTSLRVFDARGVLRYCTYHIGVVARGIRVPGTCRMLLVGHNSKHTWQQLGQTAFAWPAIVFAVDIRDGHRGPTEGFVRDRSLVDPTVAWYSWFGPAEHFGDRSAVKLRIEPARGVGGAVADIIVGADQDFQTDWVLSVFLDAAGNELHRYPYDSYKIGRTRGLPPLLEASFLPLADLPTPR